MKTIKFDNIKFTFILALVFVSLSCERDPSGDKELAGFSSDPNVFIDGFSGGLDYFPFGDSYFEAFSVDDEEKYDGTASMRFDVPNVGDPSGAYAGAIFRTATGRDLTEYDALTFWAKGTTGGTINEIGFGQDFEENKYQVSTSIQLTTNWRQYIIPIPDASKLTEEAGLFWYAEGPEDSKGYSFWIDELKFEKLGTIAQPRPAILGGEDVVQQTFIGSSNVLDRLTQTFNLSTGLDQTVNAAPGYFEFSSSNPNVATVSDLGVVSVVGSGTAVVTATLGGLEAMGSLTLESLGDFTPAPTPTRDPANVISIFSDAYTNVPVDFYNGYYAPFQTTQGQADIVINGDNIIKYTQMNFVGMEFTSPTIAASQMTHMHIDIQVENPVNPGDFVRVELRDFGADAAFSGGDDSAGSVTITNAQLVSGSWASIDILLSSFGLTSQANIGQIVLVTEGTNPNATGTITDILVDNLYLYEVPTTPTDAPDTPTEDEVANNVISIFSDSYSDIGNDGLNNFDSGSVLSVETIASNEVLKYSNLNFTGLEFLGANIIDASATTTLHLDVWSPDANELKIKLVDFGANGAFQGGDDSEFEINLGPTPTNQWVRYNIPLTDFTGLTSTAHLAQIILVNAPTGTLFIDNLYFSN
ncbi:Ig-like domain-containing protein [Flavisericum labens]|uniref:Ig-like domain-containing protein n=1 Tax=Flavisericum labens TaxID=3377112 RepID=UPI00387B4494